MDMVGIFCSGIFYLWFINMLENVDEQIVYGNRNMVPIGGCFGSLLGGDVSLVLDIDILSWSVWGVVFVDFLKMIEYIVEWLIVYHVGLQASFIGLFCF